MPDRKRFERVGQQDTAKNFGFYIQLVDDALKRDQWLRLPYIGCDGLPKTGQAWLRRGLLAATVYIPPNTPLALEMLSKALAGDAQPPERTMTTPKSIPSLEELASKYS